MSEQLPPAMFIADAVGLDFLNTMAKPTGSTVEWLASGEDLLNWLEQAKLVPLSVLDGFRQNVRELDGIAAQARELREWFRGFVMTHKGAALPASAVAEIEPLNRLLALGNSYNQVERGESGMRWKRLQRWPNAQSLLVPVAEAVAHVICDEDFTQVKHCEGEGCTLLFADKTRGHARRWCSMAICGNRAKQAAHRARKQK